MSLVFENLGQLAKLLAFINNMMKIEQLEASKKNKIGTEGVWKYHAHLVKSHKKSMVRLK